MVKILVVTFGISCHLFHEVTRAMRERLQAPQQQWVLGTESRALGTEIFISLMPRNPYKKQRLHRLLLATRRDGTMPGISRVLQRTPMFLTQAHGRSPHPTIP